ncbi:stage II sporulation protein P [Bacillus horti]|uniref:Stage II sporulation protein P n=1 Tax=Caldalkalibacillus horti TaxID=77523 RepID=A0ABT9VT02_9BACI|nr:stage II sporulation protein P [Bacillus horti]MDQ0164112.1 stage II sporulation protein P [Bacillus horti]
MSPLRRRKNQTNYPTFVIRRLMMLVMVGVVLFLFITTAGSALQSRMNLSSSWLKNWTTHISMNTLITALSREVPQMETFNASSGISTPNVSTLLFEMITSFNPTDPRSLIRGEVPGFTQFEGQIVVAGQGVNYTDFPMESSAPPELLVQDREAVVDGSSGEPGQGNPPALTTEGRKVVFVYHTHNTESYLPQLPSESKADNAYHPEVNITLVGQRLGQELERRGIGTYVDTTNIAQQLLDEGLDFADSYSKSKEVVQEVMTQEEDITFMFDLHRDSARRDKTTVKINDQDYARTFFIIGARNENYEKNLAFAEEFHNKLEEAYPGLSRGVFLQARGHGEYNQSHSENNILIEIGGVDNTLEEAYRTAEALADVISDLYWDAEKVNASSKEEGV